MLQQRGMPRAENGVGFLTKETGKRVTSVWCISLFRVFRRDLPCHLTAVNAKTVDVERSTAFVLQVDENALRHVVARIATITSMFVVIRVIGSFVHKAPK